MYVTAGVTDIRAAGDSSPPNDEFEPPSSHASSSRRLSLLDCPTPNTFFYDVKFELDAAYGIGFGGCSSSEIDHLDERMHHYFNEFSFHTDLLGPVEVTPCQSTGRRQLATSDETTFGNLSEADEEHRNLMYHYKIARSHSGRCKNCWGDNGDGRRLSPGIEPITISVHTDDYPDEMKLLVTETHGDVLYAFSKFDRKDKRENLMVYLAAGEEYKLKMRDSDDDGWCCRYGGGSLRVYEGYDDSGREIDRWSTDFRDSKVVRFTVPYGITNRYRGADPNVESFMQLSDELSKYVTYHIQKEVDDDRDSCLHDESPEVTVTLTPGSAIPGDSVCGM